VLWNDKTLGGVFSHEEIRMVNFQVDNAFYRKADKATGHKHHFQGVRMEYTIAKPVNRYS
jgi:hypothetical protein